MQTIKDFAQRSADDHLLGLLKKIDQPNVVPAAPSQKAQLRLPRRRIGTTPASLRSSIGLVVRSAVLIWGDFAEGGWNTRHARGAALSPESAGRSPGQHGAGWGAARVKTARGAVAYVPGEHAEKYRRAGTAA